MTTDTAAPATPEEAPPRRLSEWPDERGRYGPYGGVYVPETLIPALHQLEEAFAATSGDENFWQRLRALLNDFGGRPTPLYHAERLERGIRRAAPKEHGAEIWLKREDLLHTGAHKLNNTLGQALLTKKMGKRRVIAETGAGQHGVATATAAAHFGLECTVYMGAEDARRQRLNVIRMELMGAEVVQVEAGSRTLKDATNEAMRDWMGSYETTHYILGSVVGPHPFPMIVREFQRIIGIETKAQCLRKLERLPECVVACVGGGSNAIGIFHPFIEDIDTKLIGVEAGGRSPSPGDHAAPLSLGSPGVLHGSMSYVMQDEHGQTLDAHSCSAGLDYPGVGPEHSFWKDSGRVVYEVADDTEALRAFQALAREEGIIPALETSHAIAAAMRIAPTMPKEAAIVVCCSGRGDKDVDEAARLLAERRN